MIMFRILGKVLRTIFAILVFLPMLACGGNKPATSDSSAPSVSIPASKVKVLDGDTVRIGDETIRLLGIDTPERGNAKRFKGDQEPHASKAADFLEKLIKKAGKIEIKRAKRPDQYGRTLGYLYAGKKNLNVELIKAGLAWETVSAYGTNGFKAEAAEIKAAWKKHGEPKFTKPYTWRKRNTRK